MASLTAVCDLLGNTIAGYINTAPSVTVPGVVFKGWPTFEDLTRTLQANQLQISIYPLEAMRDTTRFYPRWMGAYPNVTLTAAVSGNTITFGGTSAAGYNVHTVLNDTGYAGGYDALYQTITADTPTTVATAVAAAINALSVSGLTASSSGAVVTIVGAKGIYCNVGGSVTLSREVRRMLRQIQVSVWAAGPDLRGAAEDVIVSNVGTATRQKLYFADGTSLWVRLQRGPVWDDQHALDSSLYGAHMIYECEYPTLETATFTQIGDVQIIASLNGGANLPTLNLGGKH